MTVVFYNCRLYSRVLKGPRKAGTQKICIIPEIMLDEKVANLVQIMLTSPWSLGFKQAKLL